MTFSSTGWSDRLRRLDLVDKVTLLSVFTKVTDEALTMSSFRPVELEELITDNMSRSLGSAAAKHATFESVRDARDSTTTINGRLAVVPDVGSLIDSIDKLIEDAYAKGFADGGGKSFMTETPCQESGPKPCPFCGKTKTQPVDRLFHVVQHHQTELRRLANDRKRTG